MSTSVSTELRVNGKRLLDDLAALARIGATPGGGVSRPAYSDEDIAGRAFTRDLMRGAGLFTRVDAAGNTFGRRSNGKRGIPLIIGSHTDSVPDGGRFDGALGTLAAIEVARVLNEQAIALRHPLDVVDFQNEEGGLVGSKIVSGRFDYASLNLVTVSGFMIRDGIARLGGDPSELSAARIPEGGIAGYLELHIEQGRVVERAGAKIGVVEGLVAIQYWEVTFDGTASHAGTTPMADRHDALLAASRFVQAVNEVVTSRPGRQVGTVGRLKVFPGGANVIPGRVVLTLELRDLETSVIASVFEQIHARAQEFADASGTKVKFEATHANAPSPTDPRVRSAIHAAASALGLPTHEMPSGAGHDAQNMAVLGPSGMIFVPSVNGISHSPLEYTIDEDVINGANVLLGALLRMDEAL